MMPTVEQRIATRLWSIRKLADYLADNAQRTVTLGRERLRQLLRKHEITFQRTKTWKESTDPQREAKLDRIEHVIQHFPQRTFAFDEFGPRTVRPQAGAGWRPRGRPDRLPANYHKLHGVRQFHGVGAHVIPQVQRFDAHIIPQALT
jgi:hypothetical protein